MFRTRRGNAAVTAISLAALLSFGALAVDVAFVRVVNAQLQGSIDAAVLGGAGYLDGTPEGVVNARVGAAYFGNANPVSGFAFAEEDVKVGIWTEEDGFVEYSGTPNAADAAQINALRVDAEHGGITSILAGAAFGITTLSTRASSLAVREMRGKASEVECYLPIALPDCNFPTTPTENPAPIHITFGTALSDNVAWAHPTNANGPNVQSQLNGFCTGSIAVGDDINVKNGVASSLVSYVAGILNNSGNGTPLPWPAENFPAGPPSPRELPLAFEASDTLVNGVEWGTVIGGPIALIAMGGTPGSCAGSSNFNQDREITGFTYGFIYDARDGSAGEKGFMLQLDFINEYDFGTDTDPNARGNVTAPSGAPKLYQP